jgi:hypothetical protein
LFVVGLSGVKRETRSYTNVSYTLSVGSVVNTYIHEGVPSFPEVAVRYDPNGVAELVLDIWGYRDHEPNELLFYCRDFFLRELVISILILRTWISIYGGI